MANVDNFPIRQDVTVIEPEPDRYWRSRCNSSFIRRIHKQRYGHPGRLRMGWKIKEEVGIVVLNDHAISMLEVNTGTPLHTTPPDLSFLPPMGKYVRRIFNKHVKEVSHQFAAVANHPNLVMNYGHQFNYGKKKSTGSSRCNCEIVGLSGDRKKASYG